MKADYYDVLGVPHDAEQEEIRRAFHARARACHPDITNDPAGHRRFRELAEAYGVLSNAASRLLYDRYGYRGRRNRVFNEELDERGDVPRRGQNVHARIEIEWFEADQETHKLVRYMAPTTCEVCYGRGVLGVPDPECEDCYGTGQVREVDDIAAARILRIETCPACGVDPCEECDGTGVVEAERRLRVRIPPGLQDGDHLRAAGKGGVGEPGATAGDLLLEVDVLPEPKDSRLVRYLALGGLLLATAVLVAYLLLT
jgi:molecular chaperone DnaJ